METLEYYLETFGPYVGDKTARRMWDTHCEEWYKKQERLKKFKEEYGDLIAEIVREELKSANSVQGA